MRTCTHAHIYVRTAVTHTQHTHPHIHTYTHTQLCNACGLYERTHAGKQRPEWLIRRPFSKRRRSLQQYFACASSDAAACCSSRLEYLPRTSSLAALDPQSVCLRTSDAAGAPAPVPAQCSNCSSGGYTLGLPTSVFAAVPPLTSKPILLPGGGSCAGAAADLNPGDPVEALILALLLSSEEGSDSSAQLAPLCPLLASSQGGHDGVDFEGGLTQQQPHSLNGVSTVVPDLAPSTPPGAVATICSPPLLQSPGSCLAQQLSCSCTVPSVSARNLLPPGAIAAVSGGEHSLLQDLDLLHSEPTFGVCACGQSPYCVSRNFV